MTVQKFFLVDEGDQSVGIFPRKIVVEFDCEEFDKKLDTENGNRDKFRKEIIFFFSRWIDVVGSLDGWFDDECPDCHEVLVNGECENPDCICATGKDDFEDDFAEVDGL